MSDEADDQEPEGPPVEIHNAADEKSLKRQRNTAKRREKEEVEVCRGMLSTVAGRRFAHAILHSLGTFDQRFGVAPDGSHNPIETQRQEGEHRGGWRLYLSWMALDPEGVALMMRENDPVLAGQSKRK